MPDSTLQQRLQAVLGIEECLWDPEIRATYSEDIAGGDAIAAVVVRPRSLATLREIMAVANDLEFAVYPRGAGHSYSSGYVPVTTRAILVDMSAMDRICEIDAVNRYVRVEAGCTWAALLEALAPHGLRTPFFGPLSGYRTTIGGALSQGATFFGAAMHGFSERSVLGLTVALPSGDILRTGLGADARTHPRPSGPDLSGLFLSDCGAMGIKADSTLRLIKRPDEECFASFAFQDMPSLLAAQTALTGQEGLGECFGFDRQAHLNLAAGGFTMLEGAQIAADVVRQKGSVRNRISRLTQLLQDRQYKVAALQCSLHLCIEGESSDHAASRLMAASAVALEHGGEAIPDTIPRVTRSRPFRPIKALLGPKGERWLPMHGIFRLSDAAAGYRRLSDVLREHSDDMAVHNVKVSLLTVTSGTALLIEAHLFWHDSLNRFHHFNVTEAQARQYGSVPPNLEARQFVHKLREDLGEALSDAGAEFLQIGRHYPYQNKIDSVQRELLRQFKSTVDPNGILAPGVLFSE